ncbi:U2 small nuclear ribonucleoprotein auxiliary factor 35 kDa subunit-related protein 2 [Platysternon megacephalum]|uniref:U2 small nuclear ribonucleoprotein auxiliary factor 35 kDa subunit-related protein 2 n=1 Tax=Platysternon megacephalum TaxID=55544 RepID=A0A4D9ETX0_9SAUR|nr:U2 small nuclear ribonucleoprotein auxiliary factor 35 kDa subunit-related protein 2 [Platysternon megacephalum]
MEVPNAKVRRQGLAAWAGLGWAEERPQCGEVSCQQGHSRGRGRRAARGGGEHGDWGWRDGGLEPQAGVSPCLPAPCAPLVSSSGEEPSPSCPQGTQAGVQMASALSIPGVSPGPSGVPEPTETPPPLPHEPWSRVGHWGGKDLLGEAVRAARWTQVCPAWRLWPKPPWPCVRCVNCSPLSTVGRCTGSPVWLSAGRCRTEPHSVLKGDPAAVIFNPFPTLPGACGHWSLTLHGTG